MNAAEKDSEAKTERQYGLWDSPITPLSLARGMNLSDLAWGRDGSLVWLEVRAGRGVLVVQPPGGQAQRDLNSEFSVRARLGYGGGDFSVGNGQVYFVDAESGRIYRQPLAQGRAGPLTPAFGRAASPALSPDARWLLFVHSYEDHDALAIVDAEGQLWPQKLACGADFYMQPAWHPDGRRFAWIDWNHPYMPWDSAYLRLGELSFGAGLPTLERTTTVAGDQGVSVFQPGFSPDGRYLAYVSDASGWWQIYLYDLQEGTHRQLTRAEAEHGAPAWVQGMRTYAFDPCGERLFFLRNRDSAISLWQIELDSGDERRLLLDPAYTWLSQVSAGPGRLALIASGDRVPSRVISWQFAGSGAQGALGAEGLRVWRRSTSEELSSDAYSQSQAVQWQGKDDAALHGLFYPPQNPGYASPGKPPLIVQAHGGPTDQAFASFNPRVQFFTSRGYAVLLVNYRGSTGYGRAYRGRLRGNWGVYDVQDTVSGAQHLASQGLVDQARLVIMGGSAGGYTVLKALEDYPGFFKAGICLYGISNHFTLLEATHKFEAHYSDWLLGPLPEAADIYRQRSPIFFAERIQDALAVFQGEQDPVVPRQQADDLVAILRRRGVPHIYHLYPGEGHGFRQPETIEHLYAAIERFLRQHVIYA